MANSELDALAGRLVGDRGWGGTRPVADPTAIDSSLRLVALSNGSRRWDSGRARGLSQCYALCVSACSWSSAGSRSMRAPPPETSTSRRQSIRSSRSN